MRPLRTGSSALGALLALASGSLALAVGSSCSVTESCTDVGCGIPFEVRFATESVWPEGEYEVTVKADGLAKSCRISLPLSCDRATDCPASSGEWHVSTSGCALAANQHALEGIAFSKAPRAVDVTVSFAGREVLRESFSPEYTTTRPNGESCEPVCETASAEVVRVNFEP